MPFFQNAQNTQFYGVTQMNDRNATGYIGDYSAALPKLQRENGLNTQRQPPRQPVNLPLNSGSATALKTNASPAADPRETALQLVNQPFEIEFPGHPHFKLVYTPPASSDLPGHPGPPLRNHSTAASVSSSSSSDESMQQHAATAAVAAAQQTNPGLAPSFLLNSNRTAAPPTISITTPPIPSVPSVERNPSPTIPPIAVVMPVPASTAYARSPSQAAVAVQTPAQIPAQPHAVQAPNQIPAPAVTQVDPVLPNPSNVAIAPSIKKEQGVQTPKKQSQFSKVLVKMYLKKRDRESVSE